MSDESLTYGHEYIHVGVPEFLEGPVNWLTRVDVAGKLRKPVCRSDPHHGVCANIYINHGVSVLVPL